MIPRIEQNERQNDEQNCAPLSDVRMAGTPCRDTQPLTKAMAHVWADMSATGIASGQQVVRSMIVSRYLHPLDRGRGPTRSILILLRGRAGTGTEHRGAEACRVTFLC